jgi:hypothetical protein
LADRETKKREIELEIFAAQQRREEALAGSNNLVVVGYPELPFVAFVGYLFCFC